MGKDSISRCELFNILATIPAPPEANDFKAKIYEVIQEMETAERPQGEWIDIGGYEVCKNCHEVKRFPHWNFCPNCGAQMKGEGDE